MILQYVPGFPGITERDGKVFVDTGKAGFEEELLGFYENYLMVSDDGAELDGTRFILSREAANGFYDFLEIAADKKDDLVALKGQTTGPVTFCTGLVDNDGRAIYFSRSVIPYDRDNAGAGGVGDLGGYLRHLGIYAYRRDFLFKFTSLDQGRLEKQEKLEQLRAIENGYTIITGKVEHSCEGIDTAEQYAAFVQRCKK